MTVAESSAIPRAPGRPREFSLEQVLDGAIRAFSENGYGATSIGELSAAMGLSQGSIYKAFGDKRAVLTAALDRYIAVRAERLGPRLAAAQTGRDRVAAMLTYYAENSIGEVGRRGCLVVGTLAELSSSDPELERRLTKLFQTYEAAFAQAIRVGQTDGSVPVRVDAAATARMLLCVIQGMRVIGKTGRTEADMQALVADALKLLD